MSVDLASLLAPVSEEQPSGEDLAYDPERHEIEQAFESSVSVDMTGEDSQSEIDWRKIIKLIQAQSARTKDVWLAVYLTRAAVRSGDLPLLVTGSEYLAGLLETYWDTVHPQLEEYGFQGRKGPCDSLANPAEFLNPLRQVVLIEHPRLGRFTGADFERFASDGTSAEGYSMFRAALDELGDEGLRTAAAQLEQIREALKRVDGVLVTNADGETGTNFAATYNLLDEIRSAVLGFSTVPAEEVAPDSAAEGGEPGPAPSGPRIAGRVESREDVVRALDAICEYYRQREPASPMPLVLQRAREWVTADFLTLIQDIAPGGLDEAKRILSYQITASESEEY